MIQLKQIRKYLFENYHNIMQKLNNHLIKIKTRPKQTLFQQFKIELSQEIIQIPLTTQSKSKTISQQQPIN